jgi:hypothetical protein
MGLLYPTPKATPKAERRVRCESNPLGKIDLTFPPGHTYAEDEETIVLSYARTTLTIVKRDVKNLHIEATYIEEE